MINKLTFDTPSGFRRVPLDSGLVLEERLVRPSIGNRLLAVAVCQDAAIGPFARSNAGPRRAFPWPDRRALIAPRLWY